MNTLQLGFDLKNLLNLFNSSWGVSKYMNSKLNEGRILKYERTDAEGYPVFSTPTAVSKDIKTPEEKAFGHHLMNVKSEMEAAITQLMAISDGEKRIRYAMLLRKLLKGTLSMTSWAEG